jgi:UDP-glucose:glycoprotein glucosyltransferase
VTTEDSSSSDQEELLESDIIFDVLGDADDQVDLTTPLEEEEISSRRISLECAITLTYWFTLGIAVKSAQLVMRSPDPLRALIHLSQNFPKYATSVARRVTVDAVLLEELELNSVKAQGGINMVWLNGLVLQEGDINPFG